MSIPAAARPEAHPFEPVPTGRPRGRLVVVSDRLPIALTREPGQSWRVSPVRGALISALQPVLRDRKGVWIGSPDVTEEEAGGLRKVLTGAIHEGGFALRPVLLKAQERREGYSGFAGEVIWPLFHDLSLECNFSASYWQTFRKLNRKFARAVVRSLARGGAGTDLVWVNDPLLMNVGAELKKLGVPCRTAFFLHLPFPSPDLYLKLPWREDLLAGLLAFQRVGFQTERDLANFLACVRLLAPGAALAELGGGRWLLRGSLRGAAFEVLAGACPIGVDFRQIAERAARPEVNARAEALRASLRGRRILLGIDRVDRAHGIPEKLRAYAEALTRYPDLKEKVSLVQVALPSREGLPRHAALRSEIERLVGEINGFFGRPGWVPVEYLHRDLGPEEILAWQRAADVALVTPLKSGMHLSAKELCAADLEERKALVLSEFAGAAPQLGCGALRVNPFDCQGVARTLRQALTMKERERRGRMRKMREEVRQHDVFWWANAFLGAALQGKTEEQPALTTGIR
ncbi:MAG TPA: trehalose-6-phosphate synthase [Thermoanaerobaculia bacterium]|nr:trehalose-6-phosphate synthase [Thermoanaerobaculia bacterium]